VSSRSVTSAFAAFLVLVAFLSSFGTAWATHETVVIDGDLTDLISAINDNLPGATRGGFPVRDTTRIDVCTFACCYVNGYDAKNYYLFLDFRNPDGSIASNIKLYAGWDVAGVIGDVDGDGNANTFSNGQGGCAINDQTGIGSGESYTIEFDFDCNNDFEFRIGLENNKVQVLAPSVVDLSAQSDTAMFNGFLELRIDNLRALLPPGADLCDAHIRMTANSRDDGLGEDRSDLIVLAVPPQILVTKTPETQSVCPNQPVDWTITVTNNGLCELDGESVDDVLPAGVTFLSSIPPSTGDAQNRHWDLAGLASGASHVITLRGTVASTCVTPSLENRVTARGTHDPGACGDVEGAGPVSATATLNCSQPPCDITGPGAVCSGSTVTLCGPESDPPGNFTYAWTGPGPFTATTRCIVVGTAGTYRLVVTDTRTGCSSPECTHALSVNPLPPCDITGPAAVCTGTEAHLCGPESAPPGNFTYAWTGPGPFTATTRCVDVGVAGTYRLVVTDTRTQCVSAECTHPLTVNPLPPCTITGDDAICTGGTAHLCGPESDPPGNFTYAWTGPGPFTATTRCIDVSAAGTYRLVVTDTRTECVSAECTHVLTVNPLPPCTITGDDAICSGGTANLCGPESTPPGNFTYAWTGPGPFTATTRCVDVGDVGIYRLVVTDTRTLCISEECTHTLSVGTPPTCSITGAELICEGAETVLCGPSGDFTYAWSGGITATTRCVTVGAGTYTLVITDRSTGCASDPCSHTIKTEPCASLCRITGGGCLNELGVRRSFKENTFGGNVSPLHEGGGPTGNEWEHVRREGKKILFNFHSHDAHIITCTVIPPGPCSPPAVNTRADFEGTGQYSMGPSQREFDGNFSAYIIDHGEGRCGGPDYYTITVREGLVQGAGAVVFSIADTIDCGNLQVHETPSRIFEPGGTLGDEGASIGNTGLDHSTAEVSTDRELTLNRVIPNPFSGGMSYSYRVPAGGDQHVGLGAYDIAGRLVRTLVSGAQATGQYTVRWDGRSDEGTRVKAGIYFLRARVGNAQQVTRMVYLDR
jgi:uncharacterized repeat protein (TIGR01451 family)